MPLKNASIFRSNIAFAIMSQKRIAKAILTAAAEVVRVEAERKARAGMLGGEFVTPELGEHVYKDVTRDEKGLVAYIGTPIVHGKYWEEGHKNIFIGRRLGKPEGVYIRVPWLTNAKDQTKKAQVKAANKAADKAARKFAGEALARIVGLTGISPLRSTVG